MTMKPAGKDLFAEFKKTNWAPFERYRVAIKMKNIVGGTPKDPKMIEAWLNAKNKELTDAQRKALVEATKADLPNLVEETEQASGIGFRSDDNGLFIEGRQVKSMLKESSNIIKAIAPGGRAKKKKKGEEDAPAKEELGITNLKSKVAERLFVEEDKIYLNREEPDYVSQRPISVWTPAGKVSAIKRSEICIGPELEFTLCRQRSNEVPEKTMMAIFEYAQQMGLGADRSQGYGRFTVISIHKLED